MPGAVCELALSACTHSDFLRGQPGHAPDWETVGIAVDSIPGYPRLEPGSESGECLPDPCPFPRRGHRASVRPCYHLSATSAPPFTMQAPTVWMDVQPASSEPPTPAPLFGRRRPASGKFVPLVSGKFGWVEVLEVVLHATGTPKTHGCATRSTVDTCCERCVTCESLRAPHSALSSVYY